MKRGSKIWLIVALVFAIIGGGLCLSASVLGVDYDNVIAMVDDGDFTWRIGPFRWFDSDSEEVVKHQPEGHRLDMTGRDKVVLSEQMELLDIDMDYGSLTVKASDSNEVWLDAGNDADFFEWYFDGSTLTVQNVEHGLSWIGRDEKKATLYIPSGSSFDGVSIDVDAGSCRIETDIQCNMMEVDVDAGAATLKNIEAGWLNLNCDAGKITFEGSVSDSGEVDVNAGSIDMTLLKADAEDYNYDINVSAGSLTINDKKISGLEHEQYIDNGASREWSIGCDAGKISMNIKK